MKKYLKFGNNSKWVLMMFLFSSFVLISCQDDMEVEPETDISDTTKVDSLKGARLESIQAVTTQSTYWKFVDSDGDVFKPKFKMTVWVFPMDMSDEEIDSKKANGTLGNPSFNKTMSNKYYDSSNEIRAILPFNRKIFVKVILDGGGYESDRTYQGDYYHFDRLPTKKGVKRVYQHFEFGKIDKFRCGC